MKISPINQNNINLYNSNQQTFGATIKNLDIIVDPVHRTLGNQKAKMFFDLLDKNMKEIDNMFLSTSENADIELNEISTEVISGKKWYDLNRQITRIGIHSTPLASKGSGYSIFDLDSDLSAKKLINNFKKAIISSLYSIEDNFKYVNENLHKQADKLNKTYNP